MMQESMANALHTKFYRYLNDFKTILGRNVHTLLGNIILRKREIVVRNKCLRTQYQIKTSWANVSLNVLAFAGPEEQHSFGQDLPNEGAVLLDLDLLLLTFCHCRVIFPRHCLKNNRKVDLRIRIHRIDLEIFACPDFCNRSGSQDRYQFHILSIFSILFFRTKLQSPFFSLNTPKVKITSYCFIVTKFWEKLIGASATKS